VEGHFWSVEHGEQFGLVGMQPLQQAIEHDEPGATIPQRRALTSAQYGAGTPRTRKGRR
jgi:hypothetical protein